LESLLILMRKPYNRLDMARLSVCSSSMAFINEQIRVEVMGAIFDVWVVEELAPVVVRRRAKESGWEEASDASSHGGGNGGVLPEFLEGGSEVSPRNLDSVQLHTDVSSLVGQSVEAFLEKSFCKEPTMEGQVEGVEPAFEEQNLSAEKE
jgi:hypothetical protein